MSETYIVTAKTIDEAIAIANREYADAEHEVSYDIIDMPKKGFLGIGARDAKIKITVSKIEKVELGSLVEEIRSMKTITDRGNGGRQHTSNGNGSVNGQKQEHAKQGQQKPSQPKPQGQPKPSQPKAEQPKQQPQQGQQKPKPSQPKAEAKLQAKPEAKLQAKKPEAKAEVKVEQKVEPKVEPKVQHKPETKPEAKPEAKPEVKVEPKAEAELQAKVEAKPETKVENTAPETQKNDTRKSHLGNEVKQKSRRTEIKPSKAENIPSSQATVSEPMGLSDFSGENKTGFGSGSYTSGRMSNDIRKKPKQNANVQNNVQDPAKANRDALRALTINVDEHLAQENAEAQDNVQAADETEKAVREKGFSQKNSSRRRDNGRRREEAAAVASVTAEAVAAVTEVTDAENDTETVEKPAEEKRLREGVTQAEMDYALDFANTLLKNMKLDAKAEQADANGDEYIINGDANVYPKINITGDDTGILIGHHGETLDAIQYLVNLSALRKSKQGDGDYVKIVVDIEGYREKREETLRALARRMAAKAVKYKRNVFLEPMNAYERRIIHSELQSYDKVSTHSVGTDKDRKIIITYEGADKREYVKKKPVNADTGVNAASGDVSSDSTPKERRRPKKPVRLPIDKLTDLLESRETVVSEETTVSAETSEDVSAVTETEVTAETEVTSSEE
jgi:spoIIIJ-associated protein